MEREDLRAGGVAMQGRWGGMERRGIRELIPRLRLRRIVDTGGVGPGGIVGGIVM